MEKILYHPSLLYVPEIIQSKIISCYYNDLLAGHFIIGKTREVIARKYFSIILRSDNKFYIKGCDVYLALKIVCYKPYGDFQLLSMPTHHWKELSMNFVTGLSLLVNWKGNSYDTIFIIINYLTKMVYYKLVKIMINASDLVNIIMNRTIQLMGNSQRFSCVTARAGHYNKGAS